MSIQSEINRILHFRDQSFEEVRNKGVTVPQDAIIDDLPDYIAQIQTGGGGTGAISIVDTPDAAGGTVRTITAVDISDTTAIAADVAQGKYFYTAAGVKTAGTASGGGGGSVSPKQVNFIDYDGTILYSYTAQEAQALSALPANPSHSGLTAQGWNWTLQEIKAQLTAMPDGPVWVGQMYITQSGDTEIDVSMPDGRLSPILTIAVNGTITVDWGDNTSADTVTGSSLTTRKAVPHTYAAPGDYTIVIHSVSGSFAFYGGSSTYLLLRKDVSNAATNRIYAACVRKIRVGSGITNIGDYAFYLCTNTTAITLPNTITSISQYAFNACYSLKSITIPSDVAGFGNRAFDSCRSMRVISIPSAVTSLPTYCYINSYALQSITIPASVTSIGQDAFSGCYGLEEVVVPSSVTNIDNNTFSTCYALRSIKLPNSITSIGNSAFSSCANVEPFALPSSLTSIGTYAFSYCYQFVSVTIPSTVTSIGNYAFSGCSGVAEYHILPTTPPTLGTTVFNGIASDCVIYVPSAKLNDYKTATNWSTYASYMQGE